MTDLHATLCWPASDRVADRRTRRLNRPARAFAASWPFAPEGHPAR